MSNQRRQEWKSRPKREGKGRDISERCRMRWRLTEGQWGRQPMRGALSAAARFLNWWWRSLMAELVFAVGGRWHRRWGESRLWPPGAGGCGAGTRSGVVGMGLGEPEPEEDSGGCGRPGAGPAEVGRGLCLGHLWDLGPSRGSPAAQRRPGPSLGRQPSLLGRTESRARWHLLARKVRLAGGI